MSLTPDELTETLHRNQGFLVLTSNIHISIGSLAPPNMNGQTEVPLIVTGVSNRKEFLAQAELACELAPHLAGANLPSHFKYFYRVEAAD